jgi:hypothetical protein
MSTLKTIEIGLFVITAIFKQYPRRTFMQITLNQDEIERAIITFVGNQGISITGKNVDVTLIAGRAPNGMSATINISNDDMPTSTPTPRKAAAPTVVEVTEVETTPVDEPEEVTAQRPLFGS